jgi:hypothetical protein
MGEILQRSAVAALLAISAAAWAHSGACDKYGCHNDKKAGNYHCHEGSLAGKTFASKEEMQKVSGAHPLPMPEQPKLEEVVGGTSYENVDGHAIQGPARSATGARPTGATGRCNDGTYTFAQHKRGACSKHEGVAEWYETP